MNVYRGMKWKAQIKIKEEELKSTYGEEGSHSTWRREGSKMSGAKSRHLRCYSPKIRPK